MQILDKGDNMVTFCMTVALGRSGHLADEDDFAHGRLVASPIR
jgi:hypothetical protein